jgi:hypothetical protein
MVSGRESVPVPWTTWHAVPGDGLPARTEGVVLTTWHGSGAIAKNRLAQGRKTWQQAARALSSGREAKALIVECGQREEYGRPVITATGFREIEIRETTGG